MICSDDYAALLGKRLMDDGYAQAKIKFLEHRIYVLRQLIDKRGGTQSLNGALKHFVEMLADYKRMRPPVR